MSITSYLKKYKFLPEVRQKRIGRSLIVTVVRGKVPSSIRIAGLLRQIVVKKAFIMYNTLQSHADTGLIGHVDDRTGEEYAV